jgi:hypothetical protein
MRNILLATLVALCVAFPASATMVWVQRGVDDWRPHCAARCIIHSQTTQDRNHMELHDDTSREFIEFRDRHLFEPEDAKDARLRRQYENDERWSVMLEVVADRITAAGAVTTRDDLLDDAEVERRVQRPPSPTPTGVPHSTPTPIP